VAATDYDLFFGTSNTGLSPTFLVYVDATSGASLSAPTLAEVSGSPGLYRFSVDWATVGAASIRYITSSLNGVQLEDTITSSPSPGTVTPSARVQNLALYPTAKTVLNRTASQVGLTQLDDPYASTDQAWVLLRDLLISAGSDLQRDGPDDGWTNFIQPASFATDGVTQSYMLPSDFRAIVADTMWNRSTRFPGVGPLSQQQVAALQARLVAVVIRYVYQIVGGMLISPVVPPAGATIAFTYVSSYWVQSSAASAPDQDRPAASTDRLLFDEELLISLLKLKYLAEKGFDTTRAQYDYDRHLESYISRNDPISVLSLGGGTVRSFDRMIDGNNVPEGNWGL